jgi:hypothetical protein
LGLDATLHAKCVAGLNVAPYKSKTFSDTHLLAALPSSRISLDYAQSVLFPEAEAGKRVVVCLRAHRFWGLEPGQHYGKQLFAPRCTRGGHMRHGALREQVIAAAQSALGLRAEIPEATPQLQPLPVA